MRTVLTILGILFILIGSVWFLQGIQVLPGRLIIGQVRWVVMTGFGVLDEVVYGATAVVLGIVLVLLSAAKKRTLKR